MSDSQQAGFGKFVPGFDFLQNLAKGAADSMPQIPNLTSWIAPTLNEEELDKRISELKTVHFWLDQNSKALGATVQALEVQKMTLATLKGMNFNIGEMANALKPKPSESTFGSSFKTPEKAAPTPPPKAEPEADAGPQAATQDGKAAPGLVDPMQLWGALTQQFQQIASTALNDVGKNTALDATKNMATGFVKEAMKATKQATQSAVKPKPKTKTPAVAKKVVKKTAVRKA